jgi:uncharacterized protein YqhQ
MEGVLMRGRNAIAVALRHPDGRIVTATEQLDSRVHTAPMRKWPFVRGWSSCTRRSSSGRAGSCERERPGRGDDVELGKGTIAITCSSRSVSRSRCSACSRCSSPAWHVESEPGLAATGRRRLIQVALFLAYLASSRERPDIHRVFQYHGAEHMTIHALEAGDPLTVDAVRKYPTAHHRCGTEFLVILVLLSIFAFSLIGGNRPSS